MAQIKDLKRMCNSYDDCKSCPLKGCMPPSSVKDNADEIVDEWVKEHPVKTYAMDFFEKFPNALKDADGLPIFCVEEIYGVKNDNCGYGDCCECIECWNQEMKGE